MQLIYRIYLIYLKLTLDNLKKANIIISGNRTAEDIVRAHYEKLQKTKDLPPESPPTTQPLKVNDADDYLTLENISCIDSGNLNNNNAARGIAHITRGQIFVTQRKAERAALDCVMNALSFPLFLRHKVLGLESTSSNLVLIQSGVLSCTFMIFF